MFLQVRQMRFNDSFSNSWKCEGISKLTRQLKSQSVKLQYWSRTGSLRIHRYLDVLHRNNDDDFSQRGVTVFLTESRERSLNDRMTYGSLIDCECQKMEKTVLSITVTELYSLHDVLRIMSVSLWIENGDIR